MPTVQAILAQCQPLMAAKKYAEIEAICRRGLQQHPRSWELLEGLAEVLAGQHKFDQAVYYSERAIELMPGNPVLRHNLGARLAVGGRVEEAVAQLREAIRLEPRYTTAYLTLLKVYWKARKLTEGIELAEVACRLFPQEPECVFAKCGFLSTIGRCDDFVRELRALRARIGPSYNLQNQFILPANYAGSLSPEELFEEHVAIGRMVEQLQPADPRPFANDPDPERPLRVGYVSQDFRNRSAAHFIEPIFANHDREKFIIHAYSNTSSSDGMTAKLKAYTKVWAEVGGVADHPMADMIRRDQVDILVDLTGWTGGNRVTVMSRHPAPVRVTYLGYANTTGIPSVQYRMVDSLTDPPGAERLATEKLVRLDPCFLCYAPPEHAPDVAPPPAETTGRPLTFGSFNTQSKLSPQTFDAWARVLKEVPGSRLLLKNMALSDAGVRAWTVQQIASRGVDAARIECRGETKSPDEHLGMYREVDVALDTFPYNGTTTTAEANWMGVPVVTVEGRSHVSRVGVSLLHATGMSDLIGKDVDEYVAIAAALAGNAARRRELRERLRERVRTSALCDARAFVTRLEAAYRQMWRGWCAGRATSAS